MLLIKRLGLRGRQLDPTRDWFSCDGDEDLHGKRPVWSKHHGHGVPAIPNLDKPQMIITLVTGVVAFTVLYFALFFFGIKLKEDAAELTELKNLTEGEDND